jgi:uncharacterized caspase-like protein
MAKRALLVGVNAYPDPDNRLRGCLNDVRQILDLLRDHFGFEERGGIRTLTDTWATTAGIKTGLRWLVAGARAGDVLVFHFSGHGSQVPDRHGDEASDGLDEIICPYDLDWDAPFTDDDLHGIVKHVPAGVNLTVVLDCCHAGTGLREAWQDSTSGARHPLTRAPRMKCIRRPVAAAAAPGFAEPRAGTAARVRRFGRMAADEGAILLAACREDQVSADAFIDGDYHGAFTYYLCDAVRAAGYAPTYGELLRRMRKRLRAEGFEQDPQLEGPTAAASADIFAEQVPHVV